MVLSWGLGSRMHLVLRFFKKLKQENLLRHTICPADVQVQRPLVWGLCNNDFYTVLRMWGTPTILGNNPV